MPAKTPMTWVANWIRVADQADDPATPASGYGVFYSKGDAPFFKNDGGTEISLTPGASDTTGWAAASSAWSYASADAPTFVITTAGDETGSIGVGMRIKLTQTTAKYFIVTAITASTITVYGGTDYTLANAAITLPYFSTHKAPLGFPLDTLKWTQEYRQATDGGQATPTQNVWYNLSTATLAIPIGSWRVYYTITPQIADASSASWTLNTTLSTGNNSETDIDLSCRITIASITSGLITLTKEKFLLLASKTPYYLNVKTQNANLDNIYTSNTNAPTIIRAVCAYL